MRLEVGTFPVQETIFSRQTRWHNGVLEINREEILGLVLQDPHLKNAKVDIVRPGESARVISYADVVEPKVKVSGPGLAYPGICNRPTKMVGSGRTHRLAGFGVVECIDLSSLPPDDRVHGWIRRQSGSPDPFFDMCPPNNLTPYASLVNLCVTIAVPPSLATEDRHIAIHSAIMRIADRLAETTRDLQPPELEVFDMTPTPGLPGYVFIPHLSSNEWVGGSRSMQGMAVYGQTRLSAPWLLTPTEMLDGAVSQRHSWTLANNPVVLTMCRDHMKKRFNFLACIIQRSNWTMQSEKEMAAERAAHLAKYIGAQGAITTTDIRGQRFVETILTLQACEQWGIRTVLLTEEEDPEGGTAPPLLVYVPELKAVVSTGTGAVPSEFPPVKRVIGAIGEPEERWFGKQPPIPGRYGAFHAQDIYGYGRQSLADY